MNFMNLVFRYSGFHATDTANCEDVLTALSSCCVWPTSGIPSLYVLEKPFKLTILKLYIEKVGICFPQVPPGPHSSKAIDSKHLVIRSTYFRVKYAAGERYNATLASYKAVSVSNDLYSNYTMSSFKLAKDFTELVGSQPSGCAVSYYVILVCILAYEKMQAHAKLAVMLNSKTFDEILLYLGEVFWHKMFKKRGNKFARKPILSVNFSARLFTVRGKADKGLSISPEERRLTALNIVLLTRFKLALMTR